MTTTNERFGTALVLGAAILVTTATDAGAQTPVSFVQEGRLVKKSGDPVTGTRKLTFKIYDSKEDGKVLWKETRTVEFDDEGYYSTPLGSQKNPIEASVLAGGSRWLGITVEGGAELTPRVKLRSVPYAALASRAASVTDGSIDQKALAKKVRTKVSKPSPDWSDVQNRPKDLKNGDDDTLGGLSCNVGHVAKFDGSKWKCEKAFSSLDALKAVKKADEFVRNIGDEMTGPLKMDGNPIKDLGGPSDKLDAATKQYVDRKLARLERRVDKKIKRQTSAQEMFWWGAVSLDDGSYADQDGTRESIGSMPSPGNAKCSGGESVCIYNEGGSHFEISILVPGSVQGKRDAPHFGNLMCWAVAPGDNEGVGRAGNEVGAHATDINGGHDHCLGPDPSTKGNQCIGIRTTGTETQSHSTIGVVCVK